MPTHGKQYLKAKQTLPPGPHPPAEAVSLLREASYAKFDETVEVAINLGVDPRHADQMVRASVVLPHGTGKTKRILVIAQGEKVKEAEAAGADFVGGAELCKKIAEGWLEFDAVVATPDMMREVGKLGRILGPRGLMPNPKTGTVTTDVGKAVEEFKGGKVEYRTDRYGNVHVRLGRAGFEQEKLDVNFRAVIDEIQRAKPASAKGRYIKKITVSATMGPGVRVDIGRLKADQD